MNELVAEFTVATGEHYFLCEKHLQMSMTCSTGHITGMWVPPRSSPSDASCSTCAMVVHGRIFYPEHYPVQPTEERT